MKNLIPILLAAPLIASAHPEHGTQPGADIQSPVVTGNGEWTYEAVPGWGKLPEGKAAKGQKAD